MQIRRHGEDVFHRKLGKPVPGIRSRMRILGYRALRRVAINVKTAYMDERRDSPILHCGVKRMAHGDILKKWAIGVGDILIYNRGIYYAQFIIRTDVQNAFDIFGVSRIAFFSRDRVKWDIPLGKE